MSVLDRMQRFWRSSRGKNATANAANAAAATATASSHNPRSGAGGRRIVPMGETRGGLRRLLLGLDPRSAATVRSDPQAKPPGFRKDERLPDVMWKPEQEFPGGVTLADRHRHLRHVLDRERQVLGRIANVAVHSIFKPMRLVFLGTCSLGVVGVTSYEAQLLLDPACAVDDALWFTYKYSVENFFASCIWETRPPELVAQALGLDPAAILRQLEPAASPADAQLSLHLHGCYTMRAIVAGFMVITQLLSIVRESMLATNRYIEHVYSGQEPPLRGVTERIIRLAGDGSDVTEVSMARYGAHILPVYENPAKWRHLVALWSLNGRLPCVWQVGSGRYGYRHSWARLEIDASYMLRTTTGKFILCIEADATNLDRAHELQKPNNDVTLEEASQAYRMIERAASRKINRPFRSLCVFLGDSLQLCDTGGTEFVTLRERIRLKKEVDVLIDAKAPLLLAILKWCGRFADKHKTIVLDATPLNFAPLELLLTRNGYTVLTPAEAETWEPPVPPVPTTSTEKTSATTTSQQNSTPATTNDAAKADGTTAQTKVDQPQVVVTMESTGAMDKVISATPPPKISKNVIDSKTVKTKSPDPTVSTNTPSATKEPPKKESNGAPAMTASGGDVGAMPRPLSGAKPPTATISDKKIKLPRLIYYPTTAATINAVHSVLTAGLAEPRLCCVLINSPFGLSHLREIAEYEEEDFVPICAAEIYDDYFRQVRIWTRMGHSAGVIQRELDQRFAPVLDIQLEIAQLQRASTTMTKL